LGIQSELGRGENLLGLSEQSRSYYRTASGCVYSQDLMKSKHYTRREADRRSNITGAAKMPEYSDIGLEYIAPGTSIFDPVLCEVVYRWFCPAGGRVLDPFAGGSVRGITASILGYKYTGIDLSARQIEANKLQADELLITSPSGL